ncbi:acyl-CoA dehydrogenase family protein [Pontibacter sp. BT310]|jgi:alkylation response protein AidB-like acyl-CoA dehydrogenase|uniref:Acyl-CoA dehydrogenase family protein n=1 Tax=Pontibacter populi TaxID=890055 RepID=A0ABS6X821_9BACT|nr:MULTISPECIES: acyl-CoA dehydrogenase family protein [Pontibacter]MBJ6117282.1 acyl-CoA dehydrogenase family protein [Pontibacter sp. BT310]MBR0569707.1 acyl-CoA dehydrogenase family protein [Microvirga sp. STS03]MBW3364135.1 acyl-CoA dehydrogenase family protein [Pontibacter populi]
MELKYTENQRMIADMVRDFGAKHIKPKMMEWDESQEFPVEVFKKLGELGLMGVLVPTEYGGSGFGYLEYVTAIAELSKIDGSIGLSMAAHNSLCTGHILQFGNEEQKQKYLPKLATAEWIGAWGLTEPNTGSDAGNMRTVAVEDGDYYVINGAKNFITHGKSGNVAVVIVRTGEVGDSHGMTAFIIEKGTPGFSAGRKENKLGMRASETTELIFQDCRVHKSQMLGNVGEGFIQAMKVLDGGRISIAALSLGIAQGAFEAALAYSQERSQFNKPISSFQGISFKLADMATEIEAAALLTYQAADMKNRGLNVNKESAMAKLYASEVSVRVANEGVQIFGGYGFTKDYPAEKFYRDAKLCTIGEGTSEIQKLVISRTILK